MELAQIYQLAVSEHQSGRLDVARQLYSQILSQNPQHSGALHLLGAAVHQSGDHETAIRLIAQSLQLNPQDFAAWHNLGEAYRFSGCLPEAAGCYENAMNLKGDFPQAIEQLGRVYQDMGRYQEAAATCLKAANMNPANADLFYFAGLAFQKIGQKAQAQDLYRRAIEINGKHALACNNLGTLLSEQGETQSAADLFVRAIEAKSDFIDAWNNLGLCHQNEGRLEQALINFRKAEELNPKHLPTLDNLGFALRLAGRLEESKSYYERILAIDPGISSARYNLGMSLMEMMQREEAEKHFQMVLAKEPRHPHAMLSLGYLLQLRHRMDEAEALYMGSMETRPSLDAMTNLGILYIDVGETRIGLEWLKKAISAAPRQQAALSNYLFTRHFEVGVKSADILAEHRSWNDHHARQLKRNFEFTNTPDPSRRLKVGFVSPDFREHSVMRQIIPLLRERNRAEYEAFCYSDAKVEDDFTQKGRELADHWICTCRMNDDELADRIYSDKIDILVDLTCHSSCNRMLMFARKPAPVQISWLGYPGTTGLSTMDYRLSDQWIDPPGTHDADYVEKTYRLRNYWCYDPLGDSMEVSESPALKNGHVTFGCLGNSAKANDSVVLAWRRILESVEGSKMVILGRSDRVKRRISKLMGDVAGRLEFVEQTGREKYLQKYQEIDLVLDTFPYNGPSTSLDAMWMGVPTVSLAGELGVGRGGRSILNAVGLGELSCQTLEEYIQKSAALGRDIEKLADIRRGLRKRMQQSALMDIPGFARDIEKALRSIWRQGSEGNIR